MSGQLNRVKIDNGLHVDGTKIKAITDVKIDSSIDNLSEVTVTFITEVDGLDNIDPLESYKFSDEAKYGTITKEEMKKLLGIRSPSEVWSGKSK